MKIGVDIRALLDKHYSGISEYTAILLRTLIRLAPDDEFILYYNSFKDRSIRIGNFDYPNVRIVRSSWPNKIFNYFFQLFFSRPKLDKYTGKVDVFWSPHINFSSFSKKTKHIITVHDISFFYYPKFFSWRKNIWHKSIRLEKLLDKASHIIAVSKSTEQDLIKALGIPASKLSAIHSGIGDRQALPGHKDEEAFFNKHGLGSKIILYLGTIEPRKNVEGLIYAYNKLRDNNISLVDWQLVLAGAKGWKYKKIYRAYERSPYKQNIKFLGYVSRREKELLYQRAKLFVYPSYYEGFGLPPLEAMARGLPVISSNVSSLPEILESAALTLNPYDIEEIAKAMELFISNEELRQLYIAKSKEQIKKFSWEKTAKEYLKLFKKLYESNTSKSD